MAINYQAFNFVTGKVIADLPVMPGASWSLALNKADTLEVKLNLKDPSTLALDPVNLTEPRKTCIVASTDDGVPIAWGRIDPKRSLDDTTRVLTLPVTGAWSYWDNCIIGSVSARTTAIISGGSANPGLNTTVAGVSLATIGSRLMQQRLEWPGAIMPFSFPAAEAVAGATETYPFINYKTIGSALTDLTQRVNGPDFDFPAVYSSDMSGLSYPVRAGTLAAPQLGTYLGVWSASQAGSPVDDLGIDDDFADFATAVWMSSQGQDSRGNSITLASRVLNDRLIDAGYPPEDYVDTSRSDVSVQVTLDGYAAENAIYAGKYQRSFDATIHVFHSDGSLVQPSPLTARPGDYIDLDFDAHPMVGTQRIPCRIMSLSGDEVGESVKVSLQPVTS